MDGNGNETSGYRWRYDQGNVPRSGDTTKREYARLIGVGWGDSNAAPIYHEPTLPRDNSFQAESYAYSSEPSNFGVDMQPSSHSQDYNGSGLG
jgi:hypothetical protein